MGDHAIEDMASWLAARGADVSDDGSSVVALIPVAGVRSPEWVVERAALLIRYIDRLELSVARAPFGAAQARG